MPWSWHVVVPTAFLKAMLQISLILFMVLSAGVAFFMAYKLLARPGWFGQWLRGTSGLALLLLMVAMGLVGFDLLKYRALSEEVELATVYIDQTGDQKFDVTIEDADHQRTTYEVLGDQWQLDVRLLVWKGPFLAMGADPLYRLDRLSGRYLSLEQERTAERSVYALSDTEGFVEAFDLWGWLRNYDLWLDADFGSAVYMPMGHGVVYDVYRTPRGIIARPANDRALQAVTIDW